jgi:hypothetical protein
MGEVLAIVGGMLVLVLLRRYVGRGLAEVLGLATVDKLDEVDWSAAVLALQREVEGLSEGASLEALEELQALVRDIDRRVAGLDAELHPAPPLTLAQRLAAEHGIPCEVCEAIINKAKEAEA